MFVLCLSACRDSGPAVREPDTDSVRSSLANIDKQANSAEKKAPVVKPEMAAIKTETKNISGQNVATEKALKALEDAQAKIQELQNENAKLLAWIKVGAFVLGFALLVGALALHWPTMGLAFCSFTIWGALVAYGVVSAHSILITGVLGCVFFAIVGYQIWKNKASLKATFAELEGVKNETKA